MGRAPCSPRAGTLANRDGLDLRSTGMRLSGYSGGEAGPIPRGRFAGSPAGPRDGLPMPRRVFWAWAWTTLVVTVCWLPERLLGAEETKDETIRAWQIDKFAHVSLFVGFGWLWMNAGPSPRRAAWVLGAGILLAAVTEVGQGTSLV